MSHPGIQPKTPPQYCATTTMGVRCTPTGLILSLGALGWAREILDDVEVAPTNFQGVPTNFMVVPTNFKVVPTNMLQVVPTNMLQGGAH